MKKPLLTLLVCGLLVLLTACGSKETTDSSVAYESIVSESQADDKSSVPTELEQRLSAAICELSFITSAEVTLSEGQTEAAVTVGLTADQAVSTEDMDAVRTLVVNSVEGLTPETVSITVAS